MRLILAEHVHGALVDGDLVLLDVAADTYFCLPAADHALSLAGRSVRAEPEGLALALCEAGLAAPQTHAEPDALALVAPARTARALLDADPALAQAPTRWRHARALVTALAATRRADQRPFAARLGHAEPVASRCSPALLADLAVFRRVTPWLPIDGLCLFRSQFLRAYLRALGHRSTWTFGVRTWPFRAHCWLQAGDVALDDEAERLVAFHLIMAV